MSFPGSLNASAEDLEDGFDWCTVLAFVLLSFFLEQGALAQAGADDLSSKDSRGASGSDKSTKPELSKDASVQPGLNYKPLKESIAQDVKVTVMPEDLKLRGRHGLRVKVVNNSDRAVLFNGELAGAYLHGTEFKCAELDDLEDLSGSQPNFISKLNHDTAETVAAAVTVGAWPSVEDILKSKSPTLKRFGRDEERRAQDEQKFGQRILWPGDSSTGTIYFASRESLVGAVVKIPARSFFDLKDQATASSAP